MHKKIFTKNATEMGGTQYVTQPVTKEICHKAITTGLNTGNQDRNVQRLFIHAEYFQGATIKVITTPQSPQKIISTFKRFLQRRIHFSIKEISFYSLSTCKCIFHDSEQIISFTLCHLTQWQSSEVNIIYGVVFPR